MVELMDKVVKTGDDSRLGDYHRYLAEFKTGDERKAAAEIALLSYKSAQDIGLAASHPVRLGRALNFSVFYYEILNSPIPAWKIAKEALVEAKDEWDTFCFGQELGKGSASIMQLLQENLTLWTPDIMDKAGDEIKEASKEPDEGQQ
ncbi:hypothetical protein V6N13_077288 [Hibiscus sabdariffa]